MSDLRDQTYAPDAGAMRFAAAPSILNEPIRDDIVIVDDGGLGDLHINHEAEDERASRNRLFGGVAVAVLVGIGAAYGLSFYMKDQSVVADSNLPSPSAPTNTAAMTPPAKPAALETAPPAAMPAPEVTAPAAPDVVKPAPVTKQAVITNTPKVTPVLPPPSEQYTAPAVTPAPVQNQAANVPEPVSPTPPASALAGNPALNEQSAQAPDEALTPPAAAQPEPAQPAAAEPAPAQ